MFMPGFEFYEVKFFFVIIFQKANGKVFKKSKIAQIYYYDPICRNKSAITPKWFNSLDSNSNSCNIFLRQQSKDPNIVATVKPSVYLKKKNLKRDTGS